MTSAKPAPGSAKTAKGILSPNFGTDKVRVGVSIEPGADVPPNTTTVGSVLTLVSSQGGNPTTCTTTDTGASDGSSLCSDTVFGNDGDTLTVTQTSAQPGLTVNATPVTYTFGGCATQDFCFGPNLYVVDSGVAPTATSDTATVVSDAGIDVSVLANDDLVGSTQPVLRVTTAPHHGTATVVTSDTQLPILHYVPAAGFEGTDTLSYTFTTANGSASADVTFTVADQATTQPPTSAPTSTPTQTSTSTRAPTQTASPTQSSSPSPTASHTQTSTPTTSSKPSATSTRATPSPTTEPASAASSSAASSIAASSIDAARPGVSASLAQTGSSAGDLGVGALGLGATIGGALLLRLRRRRHHGG